MRAHYILLTAALSALAPAQAEEAPAAMPAPGAAAPASAPASAVTGNAPEQAAPARSAPNQTAPPPARKRAAHAAPNKRVAAAQAGAARKTGSDMDRDRNPVIEAINLVATTQRAEIQAADAKVAGADWWVDALDREWIVRRPFGPGLFDSTHWFYVSYKVNGRILMSWFVDLEKGTVVTTTPPDVQNGQK